MLSLAWESGLQGFCACFSIALCLVFGRLSSYLQCVLSIGVHVQCLKSLEGDICLVSVRVSLVPDTVIFGHAVSSPPLPLPQTDLGPPIIAPHNPFKDGWRWTAVKLNTQSIILSFTDPKIDNSTTILNIIGI